MQNMMKIVQIDDAMRIRQGGIGWREELPPLCSRRR